MPVTTAAAATLQEQGKKGWSSVSFEMTMWWRLSLCRCFMKWPFKVRSHGAAATALFFIFFLNFFFFLMQKLDYIVTNGVIRTSICGSVCSCCAANKWALNPYFAAMIVLSYKSEAVTTALREHFQQQCIKISLTLPHRVNGPLQKVRHTAKNKNSFIVVSLSEFLLFYILYVTNSSPLQKVSESISLPINYN